MTNLTAQLQAAEAGSRELDLLVLEACGISPKDWPGDSVVGPEQVFILGGKKYSLPRVTSSVDSALALIEEVLPGWSVNLEIDFTREVIDPETDLDPCACSLFNHDGDHMKHVMEWAKSPALALCLALLKAREGSDAK